jgi:hypothetical protein
MTFAELRRAVLNANTLSTDFWAEDVEVDGATCRVKIETAQLGKQIQQPAGNQIPSENTLDEMERIRVTFSRDPSFEFGGLAKKPNVGTGLLRGADRDADRRLFTFGGEVEQEGDLHAVYIFQRPRRVSQGKKA